jgi:hypothetical protein
LHLEAISMASSRAMTYVFCASHRDDMAALRGEASPAGGREGAVRWMGQKKLESVRQTFASQKAQLSSNKVSLRICVV